MKKKLLSNSLILLTGLLVTPWPVHPDQDTASLVNKGDPRLGRLTSFFGKRNCPIQEFTADFLVAADRYELDWRLLPSISLMESSGGKRFLNNNIFGWDACRTGFRSIRHGIYYVASRLANSKLYKKKDLDGILRTYNTCPSYRRRVKHIMGLLGPADLPTTATLD